MPELPEVEAIAAHLRTHAVGRRVGAVDLAALSALKTYDPPVHTLIGAEVVDAWRRGKFLVLDHATTDGEVVHVATHLSRAGWLQWRDEPPTAPVRPGKGPLALRIRYVDDDGRPAGGIDLTEAGTQKRLAVHVVRDLTEVPGIARLGPEPLDDAFTVDVLAGILAAAGRTQIKGVLKDQSRIAGIGNAYSDEILHVARRSPFAPASAFTADDVGALHAAIRDTLTDAVRRSVGQGTGTLKAEKRLGMRVHGRTGEACPVCGDVIREVSFADSSLQYCATCQTGGTPLADRRLSRLLR